MSEETKPFFQAVEEGRLLLKHCSACNKPHYYPRSLCPFCFSERTEWLPASGRGEVYSYSIANRATPPYVVAYVKLAEGPMMLTNIVGCDPQSVRVGQPVEVCFEPDFEGHQRPFFKPVAPSSQAA
ncbi:MAG: Zn-ribbon domain-containing OB-fold protein [Burkholderiales bacterium]